ncbi:DUF805 domain-containing protein [Gallibacterium melopsittaci]|uniref:DUF805 domain-containing protein n=1 Tax=Gallibacterium melopsittaci TaxID=516063 RepID=A0ABV6HW63_9PAST
MNWYLSVVRKYAVFTGRARRKEFWIFMLLYTISSMILEQIDISIGFYHAEYGGVLSGVYGLALFIPSIAVGTRRLHDINRSGWWQLLWFIPIIGWIILIIFFSLNGTKGNNRFGEDPKVVKQSDVSTKLIV